MTRPATEPLHTNLVERYLRTRGRRYFSGQHDREFFFVTNTRPQRLHVHLEISPTQRDLFTIRVTPACFFPTSDQAALAQLADRWNRQHSEVAAIVHKSSDPHRIGVAATQSQQFESPVRFDDFAAFADRTIAAAIDLLSELPAVVELPTGTAPLLRDAG